MYLSDFRLGHALVPYMDLGEIVHLTRRRLVIRYLGVF